MAQGLAGQREQINHRVALVWLDVVAEVANGLGRFVHALAVAVHGSAHEPPVGFHHLTAIGARGTKVQQHGAAAGLVVAVVGEVGVGLHQAEFEQLPEQQAHQGARHLVALRLGCALQGFDGHAFHVVHRQHVLGGPVGVHGGNAQVWRTGQQGCKLRLAAGFAQIVGFFVQLPFGLGQERRHIQMGRQQARHAQQRAHVVHVAGNALAYAGVLHLDGQWPPVFGGGAVHLADGGRGDGGEAELRKARIPACAPGGRQHLIHLPNGHGFGVRAQARQDLAQLGRQQLARIHRQQLPYLHGRAAQLCELVGYAAGVGGGEQQVAGAGAFALRPLARAFGQHAAGQPGRQGAHARHAAPAAAGHGCCGAGRGSGGLWVWAFIHGLPPRPGPGKRRR